MALKIRLRQQGRTNRPFYRVVVTECHTPRDGKYVEMLGWYNPFESEDEKSLHLKIDRIQHWLDHGAEVSEKVEALIARTAPEVIRKKKEQVLAKRAKAAAVRKARNKARK